MARTDPTAPPSSPSARSHSSCPWPSAPRIPRRLGASEAPLPRAILATTFFLGGYSGPSFLPGLVWFGLTALVMVFLIMWFRWTFPRTRVDQILTFGWKVLVPLSMINVFLTGVAMYVFGMV